jgi:ABC-type branched-subunit amino acid transport system substrate-binding protein
MRFAQLFKVVTIALMANLLLAACGTPKSTGKDKGLSTVTTESSNKPTGNDHPNKPAKPTEPVATGTDYKPMRRDTLSYNDTMQVGLELVVVQVKKYNGVTVSVDTLVKTPFYKSFVPEIRQRTTYNVVVMLPFKTKETLESLNALKGSVRLAVDYYEGLKMALNDLEREGLSMNVRVVDTQADGAVVDSLLSTSHLLEADIIIGPVTSENIRKVSTFCRERNITMISPLNSKTEGVKFANNMLVLNPTIETHGENILNHIKTQYPYRRNVVIVSSGKPYEVELVKHMQSHAAANGMGTLREYNCNDKFSLAELKEQMTVGDSNLVVFTFWHDEDMINRALRELNASPKGRTIVYGMPIWISFQKVPFNIYNNIGICVSSESHYDINDPEIQKFKRRYFNAYRWPPSNYAYRGYDDMVFIGRAIKRYGLDFHYFVDGNENRTYYHTEYDIQPRYLSAPPLASNRIFPDFIKYYENTKVKILRYSVYRFVDAN